MSSRFTSFLSTKIAQLKSAAEDVVPRQPPSTSTESSGIFFEGAVSVENTKEDNNNILITLDTSSQGGLRQRRTARLETEDNTKTATTDEEEETVSLIVEIFSCKNILMVDTTTKSSDPYVMVSLGDEFIHKTKFIANTLHAEFSQESSGTFCIDKVPIKKIQDKGGLLFQVKNWDHVGANDILGQVLVPADVVCFSDGETVDFNLVAPELRRQREGNAGTIRVSFQPAAEYEIDYYQKMVTALDSVLTEDPTDRRMSAKLGKDVKRIDWMEMLGTGIMKPPTEINTVVEIVSCRGLAGNEDETNTLNPYVIVNMGSTELHRTKPCFQTGDPKFKDKDRNSFCISRIPAEDLITPGGILVTIKNSSSASGKTEEVLGIVQVPAQVVTDATCKRLEFKLARPQEQDAFIMLRFRPAKYYDIKYYDQRKAEYLIEDTDATATSTTPTKDVTVSPTKNEGVEANSTARESTATITNDSTTSPQPGRGLLSMGSALMGIARGDNSVVDGSQNSLAKEPDVSSETMSETAVTVKKITAANDQTTAPRSLDIGVEVSNESAPTPTPENETTQATMIPRILEPALVDENPVTEHANETTQPVVPRSIDSENIQFSGSAEGNSTEVNESAVAQDDVKTKEEGSQENNVTSPLNAAELESQEEAKTVEGLTHNDATQSGPSSLRAIPTEEFAESGDKKESKEDAIHQKSDTSGYAVESTDNPSVDSVDDMKSMNDPKPTFEPIRVETESELESNVDNQGGQVATSHASPSKVILELSITSNNNVVTERHEMVRGGLDSEGMDAVQASPTTPEQAEDTHDVERLGTQAAPSSDVEEDAVALSETAERHLFDIGDLKQVEADKVADVVSHAEQILEVEETVSERKGAYGGGRDNGTHHVDGERPEAEASDIAMEKIVAEEVGVERTLESDDTAEINGKVTTSNPMNENIGEEEVQSSKEVIEEDGEDAIEKRSDEDQKQENANVVVEALAGIDERVEATSDKAETTNELQNDGPSSYDPRAMAVATEGVLDTGEHNSLPEDSVDATGVKVEDDANVISEKAMMEESKSAENQPDSNIELAREAEPLEEGENAEQSDMEERGIAILQETEQPVSAKVPTREEGTEILGSVETTGTEHGGREAAVPVRTNLDSNRVFYTVDKSDKVIFIGDIEAEPEAEEETEPAAEGETEPVVEEEIKPLAEPAEETEPVVEKETESAAEGETEPVAEEEIEPVAEPVVEQAAEPAAEEVREIQQTENEEAGDLDDLLKDEEVEESVEKVALADEGETPLESESPLPDKDPEDIAQGSPLQDEDVKNDEDVEEDIPVPVEETETPLEVEEVHDELLDDLLGPAEPTKDALDKSLDDLLGDLDEDAAEPVTEVVSEEEKITKEKDGSIAEVEAPAKESQEAVTLSAAVAPMEKSATLLSMERSYMKVDDNHSSRTTFHHSFPQNRHTPKKNHSSSPKSQPIFRPKSNTTPQRNVKSPRSRTVLSTPPRSPRFDTKCIEATFSNESGPGTPRRNIPECYFRYVPDLHGSKGPCHRCMFLLSEDERKQFSEKGHHLRVMMVTGGCDRDCKVYPKRKDEQPVRLCKKCFFDKHKQPFVETQTTPPR